MDVGRAVAEVPSRMSRIGWASADDLHETEGVCKQCEAGAERTPVPEESLARSVFASLGGVVEIGAVNFTGTWKLADVSVDGFLAGRRQELGRLMDGIQEVCRFGAPGMAIADELGYLREHEVTPEFLLLWSAGLTGVPEPLEELAEPRVVRRMCRMGADLQLTRFLQDLITAAICAEVEERAGAARIAEILGIAAELVDSSGRNSPETAFRMWRVAHLPDLLRPDSPAPQWGRAAFRAYDLELERVLASA
ncbi:hypothetical protein [Streptomyces phaeochromogenes]|uniref:hypothetical protein n=1 Tax=Streptomyces phaeochromogenes TaxID=1923 RepID=UPI0037145481